MCVFHSLTLRKAWDLGLSSNKVISPQRETKQEGQITGSCDPGWEEDEVLPLLLTVQFHSFFKAILVLWSSADQFRLCIFFCLYLHCSFMQLQDCFPLSKMSNGVEFAQLALQMCV